MCEPKLEHHAREYINTGDELHLAHNFVFFHLPWQAAAVRASVQEFTDLTERAA
jgi:alpha-glucosidase